MTTVSSLLHPHRHQPIDCRRNTCKLVQPLVSQSAWKPNRDPLLHPQKRGCEDVTRTVRSGTSINNHDIVVPRVNRTIPQGTSRLQVRWWPPERWPPPVACSSTYHASRLRRRPIKRTAPRIARTMVEQQSLERPRFLPCLRPAHATISDNDFTMHLH